MSNPEHFIDEVTEELRRDRLFKLMRKYGWIGILLVMLIVGGAAFNEWRKASARASAEALGDAILSAMNADDPAARRAALAGVEAQGAGAAVRDLLAAGTDGDSAAIASLQAVSENPDLPQIYRDVAVLKMVSTPGADLTPEDKIKALEPLTAAGAAFRVLAEEQIALAEIEMGNSDAALTRLRLLLEDNESSQALRRRASQLIVALGGTVEAS